MVALHVPEEKPARLVGQSVHSVSITVLLHPPGEEAWRQSTQNNDLLRQKWLQCAYPYGCADEPECSLPCQPLHPPPFSPPVRTRSPLPLTTYAPHATPSPPPIDPSSHPLCPPHLPRSYHPDKFQRLQSVWAYYVEKDKHALDK